MTPEIMAFGKSLIFPQEINYKRVIEIGSYNVNGSYANFVKSYRPREYVAVDIHYCDHYKGEWKPNDITAYHLPEPCVNMVMNVRDLVDKYGEESFDFVISTEMLEHVEDWKGTISVIKKILRPNGYLVLTTRSPGFPLHSWPDDWWRFTLRDMELIFSDCEIIALKPEVACAGVFIKVKKPIHFFENALDMDVYSMK